MSWRLRVVHTTGFEYGQPVHSSFNEARLTPRSDSRQNVVLNRVETTPSTRAYRYTDYWGSAVTAFDLHAPHTSLEVVGSSIVETEPTRGPIEGSWSDIDNDEVGDRFNELLVPTKYVPVNRQLATAARKIRRETDSPADTVVAISEWVHEQMSYVPGATAVHTSAVEAFAERKGVCQDYAHLTLLMLRSIGVPSRYVSGYLHPRPNADIGDAVLGESHAWVEAWTGEWWSIDPTNNNLVNERHVTVGVGRDYSDVPPLKGIFTGSRSTDLAVTVEVTRLA
ncbi:transglutaminase domain-containing protein [Naumannella halotolerans]|uniref:Transglutaminase-like putative cysteine protease n=1 Tax=Naumannella halotolerans TaxID=993414 RepID=A0A4R7J1C1_9ACTN|nr:transglutaminase family protein [Naumannella halotolerans]TDT30864.1 transglutaminase-like putative cysteine protease [Naumannella halotolerans]